MPTNTDTQNTQASDHQHHTYRQSSNGGTNGWFRDNWIVLTLVVILLIVFIWFRGGISIGDDDGNLEAKMAQAKAEDFQRKLEEVTAANNAAFEDYRKSVEEQRQADAKIAQEREAEAKAEADRQNAEMERTRLEYAHMAEIEQARTEAKAEAQAQLDVIKAEMEALKVAAAAPTQATPEIEKKGTRPFEIMSEELQARWLGFDEKIKPGYKVPMMRNSAGKPTPFHPDFSAPVETDMKGNWVVIQDFPLLNGERVPAWAVKLK